MVVALCLGLLRFLFSDSGMKGEVGSRGSNGTFAVLASDVLLMRVK